MSTLYTFFISVLKYWRDVFVVARQCSELMLYYDELNFDS